MFEKYNIPAFFLVKNAVLSAYPCLIVEEDVCICCAVP